MDAEMLSQVEDLQGVVSKMMTSCETDDHDSALEFARQAITLIEGIMAVLELDIPTFAAEQPVQDDREVVARGMLEQYHDLTITLKIREAILSRVEAKLGLLHELTNAARDQRNAVFTERETLVWTILELMGVETAP